MHIANAEEHINIVIFNDNGTKIIILNMVKKFKKSL